MKKIAVAVASLVLASSLTVACTPQQRIRCYQKVPMPYALRYCR